MKEREGLPPPILVVDDDEAVLGAMRRTLRAHGLGEVLAIQDARRVMPLLAEKPVSLLLLDLMMPYLSGEEILVEVAELYPDLPVVVVTAEYDPRAAVRCMKLGAIDYLLKPVQPEQLVVTAERALEQAALRYEASRLREGFFGAELEDSGPFADIISEDPAMHRIFAYLQAVSRGAQPVLIVGETGTGKELVARALHQASGREGPFVAVNVAGLDDTMFSDTLFGHRPGAFTGAGSVRRGMIDRAGAGTLFLDEIGDLSEASQVKLLRVLQEREYHPLGSDRPRRLLARVVAATQLEPSGGLRPDLYYRLRSYRVNLPPLRERSRDLILLLRHFLAEAARDLGRVVPALDPKLVDELAQYSFPGNVRELQALAFDALARHGEGPLSLHSFREALARDGSADSPWRTAGPDHPPTVGFTDSEQQAAGVTANGSAADRPVVAAEASGAIADANEVITRSAWRELEIRNLECALQQARGKISGPGGAAELLEMKPSTLESRIKSLGIQRSRFT